MTKEQLYLKRKKAELINHIQAYNKRTNKNYKFSINPKNLDIESDLCDSPLCFKCGMCCLMCPCTFAPSDFIDITDINYMSRLLETGVICISESPESGLLIIRPRGWGDSYIVSTSDRIRPDNEGGNPCLLLSNNGCILPPVYRPTEGLLHFHTLTIYNEKDIEREYLVYREALLTLYEQHYYKRIPVEEARNENNIKKLINSMIDKNL